MGRSCDVFYILLLVPKIELIRVDVVECHLYS